MKIAGIQYLRAIAVIAVVIDHAVGMAAFPKYYGVEAKFSDFWKMGVLGVNLFFVISGFIIVVSAYESRTLKPRRSFTSFLIARAIRILPMMWLAIISYMLLRWLGRGDIGDPALYIRALFLTPFGDYDPNNIWTLRHEMIFYLVFGLSFLLPVRAWPIFGIWLVGPVIIALLPWSSQENTDLTVLQETICNVFAPVNALFGAGALIGLVYKSRPEKIEAYSQSVLRKLNNPVVLLTVFAFCMITFSSAVKDLQSVLISLPILVAMVFIGSLGQQNGNRLMYYLGNASFAIYLFHPHVESAMLGIMARIMPSMDISMVVATVSLASIASCCVIYSYVEVPLNRYLLGIVRKRL